MEHFRELKRGETLQAADIFFSKADGDWVRTRVPGRHVGQDGTSGLYYRKITKQEAVDLTNAGESIFTRLPDEKEIRVSSELICTEKDEKECLPPDHIPEKPAWGRFFRSAFYLVLMPILYNAIGKRPPKR